MVEEIKSVEEEIYNLIENITTINSQTIIKIKSDELNNEKVVFITSKIKKFKTYIYNSDLIVELSDHKNIIRDKLTVLLSIEQAIEILLSNDIIDWIEINKKIDSIIMIIKELEPIITNIFDLSSVLTRDGIKNNIKLYRKNLTGLSLDIENINHKIDADFEKAREDNSKGLQTLKEEQDKFKTNINKEIEEYNNTFKVFEENMSQKESEIESIKNNYIDETEKIKQLYLENYNNLEKETKNKFDNLEKNINFKDKKISELIGLIGNKANIGEYKSNADKAHNERIIWQVSTVIIFAVAFFMMCFITIKTKDYNITTLARYIVSVILLGMSGYTAKQASNQRKDEIYFRKQQLELSSMDVYLDDMPKNVKYEIKQALSNKIFGQARETYKSKYDDTNNSSIEKLITVIEELLHNQKK